METKNPKSDLYCTQHDLLLPHELEGFFEIWAESLGGPLPVGLERAVALTNWSVVVQNFNLKFPRAGLTLAQIPCALKGKQHQIEQFLLRFEPNS